MPIRIDEFKAKALEKICEHAPFEITIFEKEGYCECCPKDCYYAKRNPSNEKIQCTKKSYTFLDENYKERWFIPQAV